MPLLCLITSCIAQKSRHYVLEIYNDNCTEGYYRLKLKKIDNDSVYQVLVKKNENQLANINQGDTINIELEKMKNKEWDREINLRSDDYSIYCDGKEILKINESFYKPK